MKLKIKCNQKYSICSCGVSNIMPLCDNSHREYNKKNYTKYKSIKIIPNCDTTLDINSSLWEKSDN